MIERLPKQIENQFEFPDGKKKWFELSIEPHSHGVLIRSMDLTRRKTLEQQYLQSQKLEAVGLLAGGIAHDFNNKLGVMTLFCEMALQSLQASDVKVRQYIENVAAAVKDSAALTRQLLAFSRKQVLDLQPIDVNDLLRGIQDSLTRLLGEKIELKFFLEENLGQIKVDPSQIDQVIFNLCINARDSIEDSGQITVETAEVVLDEDYCQTHKDVISGFTARSGLVRHSKFIFLE
jgi:signal transduction histidine kinase